MHLECDVRVHKPLSHAWHRKRAARCKDFPDSLPQLLIVAVFRCPVRLAKFSPPGAAGRPISKDPSAPAAQSDANRDLWSPKKKINVLASVSLWMPVPPYAIAIPRIDTREKRPWPLANRFGLDDPRRLKSVPRRKRWCLLPLLEGLEHRVILSPHTFDRGTKHREPHRGGPLSRDCAATNGLVPIELATGRTALLQPSPTMTLHLPPNGGSPGVSTAPSLQSGRSVPGAILGSLPVSSPFDFTASAKFRRPRRIHSAATPDRLRIEHRQRVQQRHQLRRNEGRRHRSDHRHLRGRLQPGLCRHLGRELQLERPGDL